MRWIGFFLLGFSAASAASQVEAFECRHGQLPNGLTYYWAPTDEPLQIDLVWSCGAASGPEGVALAAAEVLAGQFASPCKVDFGHHSTIFSWEQPDAETLLKDLASVIVHPRLGQRIAIDTARLETDTVFLLAGSFADRPVRAEGSTSQALAEFWLDEWDVGRLAIVITGQCENWDKLLFENLAFLPYAINSKSSFFEAVCCQRRVSASASNEDESVVRVAFSRQKDFFGASTRAELRHSACSRVALEVLRRRVQRELGAGVALDFSMAEPLFGLEAMDCKIRCAPGIELTVLKAVLFQAKVLAVNDCYKHHLHEAKVRAIASYKPRSKARACAEHFLYNTALFASSDEAALFSDVVGPLTRANVRAAFSENFHGKQASSIAICSRAALRQSAIQKIENEVWWQVVWPWD